MTDSTLPTIGEPAPDFTAQASDGNRYSLSQLLEQGPVVLIFYPGNNTPG
jgi:peroxiredoxin Q/BCP